MSTKDFYPINRYRINEKTITFGEQNIIPEIYFCEGDQQISLKGLLKALRFGREEVFDNDLKQIMEEEK